MAGESAATQAVASIRALAEADPAAESVQSPLSMHLGPHEIPLNLEIVFREGWSAVAEEGGANCTPHGDMASEACLAAIVGAQPSAGLRQMNMASLDAYGVVGNLCRYR